MSTLLTQRVFIRQCALGSQHLAVGTVGIAGHGIAAGIYQFHDVALQIGDVIVSRSVHLHGVGGTVVIVEEVVGFGLAVGGHLLLQQLAAGAEVTVVSVSPSVLDAPDRVRPPAQVKDQSRPL